MPVNTASAAVHITPVVLKTFIKRTKRKATKNISAFDDIYYDEAFHIVKAFIELGTKNTVESLQAFTNTHVPAPYWVAVVPVKIPLSSCNRAADTLIDWFGPEGLKRVVGGERWWQIRGLEWIDAEWITEKDLFKDISVSDDVKQRTAEEKTIQQMEHLDRVMLYVHGGAFFWGSINTHRYQVIRYAKTMKGRAFTVNYRKAPQYPWPCPLQDVLAAYFYLTSPPPGAAHKAIDPSKLVFAGDSAGAGLCVSALTVLRDLGLPLPAGAVLISPWVDLTHSFPSIMTNTATDIIPPHGFIHKPSTLWPAHPKPEGGYTSAIPGKLEPNVDGAKRQVNERTQQSMERGGHDSVPRASELEDDVAKIPLQKDILVQEATGAPNGSVLPTERTPTYGDHTRPVQDRSGQETVDVALDSKEPKPPKVLMEDPDSTPWELHAQIQFYATAEQLTHPLVSPVLQGSLGNLCPLYILAGDGECLRDEIIYLAHKAASPEDYPARQGVLREAHRQKENAEKFRMPTKVHLQVFDDMCHVLTVFTFTEPGKYAYQSIARFVKDVMDTPGNHLKLHKSSYPESAGQKDVELDRSEKADYAGHWRGEGESVVIIRERVNPFGEVRPMEPIEEMPALCLQPNEIGLLKEQPVRRWLAGQEAWDKRFKRQANAALRKQKHYEAKWERLLEHAKQDGLFGDEGSVRSATSAVSTGGIIEPDRRWGPLDLEDERPPPSAIAGRKDTREAVALLKSALYYSAPRTHPHVPKLRTSDVIRAALDPTDVALKSPPQSVSEQQVRTRIASTHGLKLWQSIVESFMRKSLKKVADGEKRAASTLRSAKDKVTSTATPSEDRTRSTKSK